MGKKSILIIAFTALHKDPRVIRQVDALQSIYNIETIGFTQVKEDIKNHKITPQLNSIFKKVIRKVLSFAHLHTILNYFLLNDRLKELNQLGNDYSLIICNDLYPLPLGVSLAEKFKVPLWSDLHEYYPSQVNPSFVSNWEYKYHILWLCKKYITKATFISTVCDCIAKEYKLRFNIEITGIIDNATFYNRENKPSLVSKKVRIVHHGVAASIRKMEEMVYMMKYLGDDYELIFYLIASSKANKAYLNKLKEIVFKENLNIKFEAPVSTNNLSKELNKYDIGLFILPPLTLNYKCALPNKLFEFIQARLAIAVSPNTEMKRIVESYNLGVVSDDYTAISMAKEINSLTKETIEKHKEESHKWAMELSAEKNISLIQSISKKMISSQKVN